MRRKGVLEELVVGTVLGRQSRLSPGGRLLGSEGAGSLRSLVHSDNAQEVSLCRTQQGRGSRGRPAAEWMQMEAKREVWRGACPAKESGPSPARCGEPLKAE